MRFMSELQRGKYADEFENVHPDILDRYFGVNGAPSQRDHSGAGDSDDEDGISELDNMISTDQQSHIRHDPVDVPKHAAPFASEEAEDIFYAALKDVLAAGIVPRDLGVHDSEWDGGDYPTFEAIKSGRRGKLLNMVLPFDIWWPKAVAWAQGLDLMTRIWIIENVD